MIVELILGVFGLIFVLYAFAKTVYVVKQWEKVAVLRLGRIIKLSEAGLQFKIPFLDTIRRVDLRMQTVDLRGQSAITKDNISVGVDAVVFMKIEDAEKVILKIVDYQEAVSKFAQTSVRNIIGRYTLDDLLESREEIASKLKEIVDELSKEWGVDVAKAELQEIVLPADMKRAFAVQAEAEREGKAVLIKAEAEFKASEMLAKAAEKMKDPNAMQLRILSTIDDISKDPSNTIVIALPLETLKAAGIQGVAALSGIKPKFQQG